MGITCSSQEVSIISSNVNAVNMDNEPFLMLTYDPCLEDRQFSYCARQRVFSNLSGRCSTLPRPAPPMITPQREPLEQTPSFVVDDKTTVPRLVNLLLQPHDRTGRFSDSLKVSVLYQWLVNQNLNNNFQLSFDFSTVNFQLDKIRKGENTYAACFAILCHYAKVPCVIIEGHVKGHQYVTGELLNDRFLHEWNAVFVDREWQLVDTFWGSVEDEFLLKPTQWYLFPSPKELIYTHFPKVKEWQLLDNPVNKKDFITRIVLKHFYFEGNFDIQTPPEGRCYFEAINGELILRLHVGVFLRSVNYSIQRQYQTNSGPVWETFRLPYSFFKDEHTDYGDVGGKRSLKMRFPHKGDFNVTIYAQLHDEITLNGVASFRVWVNDVPNWVAVFSNDISVSNVQNIKSLKEPDYDVIKVMRAVTYLLGDNAVERRDLDNLEHWKQVKHFMYTKKTSSEFRRLMKSLKIDDIDPENVQTAILLIDEISKDILAENNVIVTPFVTWVRIITDLYLINIVKLLKRQDLDWHEKKTLLDRILDHKASSLPVKKILDTL